MSASRLLSSFTAKRIGSFFMYFLQIYSLTNKLRSNSEGQKTSLRASLTLSSLLFLWWYSNLKCKKSTKVYTKPRSSPPEVFLEKSVLKICSKFTGEHPCTNMILKKLQSRRNEITFCDGCSPVNLLHSFRTSFPKNTSGSYFCKSSFKMDLLKSLLIILTVILAGWVVSSKHIL